jgi:hypothetical protein
MKKLVLAATILISGGTVTPAFAETGKFHALGNAYTNVLNVMEARGLLDTLEPKAEVPVKDIHVDHGQVIVTYAGDGSRKFFFDLVSSRPDN